MQELEWIEIRAFADLNRTLADRAVNLGRASRSLDGTYVSAMAALPSSAILVNRTIGLGLEAPADDATLDQVVETYGTAGIARYFVHLHPEARSADPAERLKASLLHS